jgi:hypothetical protein
MDEARIPKKFMTTKTATSDHRASANGPVSTGPPSLAAWISHFAHLTALWTGHPLAFLLATIVTIVWVVTGPIFQYSDARAEVTEQQLERRLTRQR